MTIGIVIIKYIDIHDTNGHIEIHDRMKPMHDYTDNDYPDNKSTFNLTMGGGRSELKLYTCLLEGSSRRLFTYYIVGVDNITHDIWLFLTKKHVFEKNSL